MLALVSYATGSFTLHRVLRARAKPRQAFFFFSFCIPFLLNPTGFWRDYRTIHDWGGGPLARWTLPAEAAKTASGSAAHGGSHVGRNGVWFVCFCLLLLNPQEEGWPVFLYECAGMHAAITRTFWSRVWPAALGCAPAADVVATFLRRFLFEGLPHQIPRYISHSVFITFLIF